MYFSVIVCHKPTCEASKAGEHGVGDCQEVSCRFCRWMVGPGGHGWPWMAMDLMYLMYRTTYDVQCKKTQSLEFLKSSGASPKTSLILVHWIIVETCRCTDSWILQIFFSLRLLNSIPSRVHLQRPLALRTSGMVVPSTNKDPHGFCTSWNKWHLSWTIPRSIQTEVDPTEAQERMCKGTNEKIGWFFLWLTSCWQKHKTIPRESRQLERKTSVFAGPSRWFSGYSQWSSSRNHWSHRAL